VCFRTGDDESESGRRVYDIQRMSGKTGSMSQEDGKGGETANLCQERKKSECGSPCTDGLKAGQSRRKWHLARSERVDCSVSVESGFQGSVFPLSENGDAG